MLTIIHGADFHLDSPFSGLTPQRAVQRRREQRQTLDALAELAAERRADLVLLSGDLLDGQITYRETAQALAQALGRIPCPVFLAPGNHDYYPSHSLYAGLDWPEHVHMFTTGAIQAVTLEELNCTVYGRAFCQAREDASPLAGFTVPRDGRIHVMALHAQVDGRGEYAPITREEIAASGLDYLALGHVHQCSGLIREGEVTWAYSGCPEGRGFDETGEKGVLVVQVEPGCCRGELVSLGGRQYHDLKVDAGACGNLEAAVWAALPGVPERDVYRITFTGTCPEGGVDLTGLTARLSSRVYGLTLSDRTQVERTLWERKDEDTLAGRFLRQMALRGAEDPDNETLQLAVRYGLAALEHGEDVAP